MNNLKKRLFSLNRAERIRAIRKLRSSIAHSKRRVASLYSSKKVKKITKAFYHQENNRVIVHRDVNNLENRIEMANHHNILKVVNDMGGVTHHQFINHRMEKMIEQNSAKSNKDIAIISPIHDEPVRPTHKDEVTIDDTKVDKVDRVTTNIVDSSENKVTSSKPLDILKDKVDNTVDKVVVKHPNIPEERPKFSKHIKNTEVVYKTVEAVKRPNIYQERPKFSKHIKNTEMVYKTVEIVTNPKIPVNNPEHNIEVSSKVDVSNHNIDNANSVESHNNYESHSNIEVHNDISSTPNGGRR